MGVSTVSESDVVAAILDYLAVRGIFAWRNQTGAMRTGDGKRFVRFGAVGSPDIIGVLPGGRFLGIECKTPRGRLSPHQDLFLARLLDDGALAFVARSVDDVIKQLGDI